MAEWGGTFAVLAIIHFFADWVFQSDKTARAKGGDRLARSDHCLVYTVIFGPVLVLSGLTWLPALIAFAILFVSHYVGDSYIPVFLWAKYVRRVPDLLEAKQYSKEKQREVFKELFRTPTYAVIFIAVDQIFHLLFLWPVVWLIVRAGS